MDELKVAMEAAKAGATHALKYFDTDVKVEVKQDQTVVSKADREVEETIKSSILSKFKNANFLGEEGGGDVTQKEFWIIDPIDGTRNFLRGIANWCVIVCHYREGRVQTAVIYYPFEDTYYHGQRGKGAFQDKKRLHVSTIPEFKDTYFAFGSPRHFQNKQLIIDLIEKSASSRAWDATYCGCLLVSGRIDAYIDGYGKAWDLAPFTLLVDEAGGKLTRSDGSAWTIQEGTGAIMTNGLVHDEMIKIIGGRK